MIHLDTPARSRTTCRRPAAPARPGAGALSVALRRRRPRGAVSPAKNSRLSQHDILSILKALRSIERKDRSEGEVVVTSGEILLEIPDAHRIDPDASDADTKVRIAVAWLEEARLLARHENHTRVFPAACWWPARRRRGRSCAKKLGADADIGPYLRILDVLIRAEDDEGLSTDELMLATGSDSRTLQNMLRELDRWRLLSNDIEIGVTLIASPTPRSASSSWRASRTRCSPACAGGGPDADRESGQMSWQVLNVRRLCDTLRRDAEVDFGPDKLTRLLKSFAEPFGEGKAQRGFLRCGSRRTAAISSCCAAGRRSRSSANGACGWRGRWWA